MARLKKYLFLVFLLFVSIAYAGSQQTSSTTAQTIINYARYHLNEATPSFWSDTELLVWLNQGTLDIASRTRCLEGTKSISLVADTIEYSITPNYIDVTTATYTDSDGNVKGLIKKNPQSLGNVQDPGEPVYWYEWDGKIGLFPSLSSVTTETATVYYVSRPTAIGLTASVVVPAIYDRALTLYIAAQAFLKEGAFGKSARLIAEYLAELERYRSDFTERPQEPERSVKPVP